MNFAVFRYLPILAAVRSSLWRYTLLGGYGQFIGLQAYGRMLGDPIFWKSLQVTAAYVVMKVPAHIALSMGLALGLARENRFGAIVRSPIFAPVVSSIAVVSVIWALRYPVQRGLINSTITSARLRRIAFASRAALARVA